MKGFTLLILLCVSGLNASPSQQSQFVSGQQLGHELKGQVEQIQHNGDLWEMMKPAKDTPAENAAQAAEVQNYLAETAGPRDEIDPDHDPLLKQAEGALSNPLHTVRGHHNPASVTTPQYTRKSCEQDVLKDILTCTWAHDYEVKETEFPRKEGTISFAFTELEDKNTDVVKVAKGFFIRYWSQNTDNLALMISHKIGIPSEHIRVLDKNSKGPLNYLMCGTYAHTEYSVSYVVNPYTIYSIKPIKLNNCQELEKLARQGLYRQVKEVCVDQPGENKTRTIGDQSITKPCWRFERTYTSPSYGRNTCKPLFSQGCESTQTECIRKVGDTCVRTKHSLRCPTTKPSSLHEGIQKGPMPFCIDGQCASPPMEEDDQFEGMLPQMALLSELSKASKEEGVHIFSGRALSCQKTWFKKCCGVGKSFIQQMTGSKCGEDAKTLAALRGKGYCHYVGSKPVKKKIGPIKKTIGHEEVYCCYPSVLLKAFNEQGRTQLNTGWGSAHGPVCHGFTVSEIQHLDFGGMDLGEAYQEVTQKITPVVGQRQHNISRDVQSRIQRSL